MFHWIYYANIKKALHRPHSLQVIWDQGQGHDFVFELSLRLRLDLKDPHPMASDRHVEYKSMTTSQQRRINLACRVLHSTFQIIVHFSFIGQIRNFANTFHNFPVWHASNSISLFRCSKCLQLVLDIIDKKSNKPTTRDISVCCLHLRTLYSQRNAFRILDKLKFNSKSCKFVTRGPYFRIQNCCCVLINLTCGGMKCLTFSVCSCFDRSYTNSHEMQTAYGPKPTVVICKQHRDRK